MKVKKSGEGGIRTLGDIAATPVFETGPIGHSGTSPTLDDSASPVTSLRRSPPREKVAPPMQSLAGGDAMPVLDGGGSAIAPLILLENHDPGKQQSRNR